MCSMVKKVLLFTIVFLVSACAKRVPLEDTFQGKSLKVGSVVITRGELPEEREDRANRIQLEEQIKAKIEKLLQERNLYDASSKIIMTLHIDQFRLRHAATRFFTGIYSGSDRIEAHLTVADGASTFISKRLEASGGNFNPIAISSTYRGERLSAAIAKLAVAALQREPVLGHSNP